MNKFLPFTLLLLAVAAVLAACGTRPETAAVKPGAAQTAGAGQVPAETKDADIPSGKYKDMYCVKNNAILFPNIPADKTPAFYNPEAGDGKNAPEQVMKYDRVRMYEVKGDWARVELTTKTQRTQRQGGWIVRTALDEWQTTKFFNVKDNVFKAKKEIVLFGNSLSSENTEKKEQAIGSVSPNETYRVLKGNGERFYVVTSNGNAGWVESGNVDKSRLVVKEFSYRQKISDQISPSSIVKDSSGNPVRYDIMPEDMTDPAMLSGKFQDVPRFLNRNYFNYSYTSKVNVKDTYIAQGNQEINIMEKLNFKKGFRREVADGIEYEFNQYLILNFFGMIAHVDVGIPVKYLEAHSNFYISRFGISDYRGKEISLKDYESMMKWIKDRGPFEEVVNISLYTRDIRLKKIKDIKLKGVFAFSRSLELFADRGGDCSTNNENIQIIIDVIENGVSLDRIPLISDVNEKYGDFRVYADNNELIEYYKNMNLFKPRQYEILITKDELKNSGVSIAQIMRTWNSREVKATTNLVGLDNNRIISSLKNRAIISKAVAEKEIGLVYKNYLENIGLYIFSFVFRRDGSGGYIFIDTGFNIHNFYLINNSFGVHNLVIARDSIYWIIGQTDKVNKRKYMEAVMIKGVLSEF